MKQLSLIFSLLIFALINAKDNYTRYVNPFVGTNAHGHTFPGATTPFGMVQLSPDTRIDGSWDGCSGYHYSDSVIYGFSHTHLSGTGCSDYGDIAFMPVIAGNSPGKISKTEIPKSSFSHKNETASAGYYSVVLDNGIFVELSSTARVGIQKYTYSRSGYAMITLDLTHRDEMLEGKISLIDKHSFAGYRRSKAWAEDQLIYYYFTISRDPDEVEILKSDKGEYKINLSFKVKKGQTIMIKTALSSVDENGARNNLEKELAHWDFLKVKQEATTLWNNELSRIKVYGGSPAERQNFYTALYHCMMHPNIMNDVDGRYRGRDNKVHQTDGFDYYTVFSLWDTYRALHPLLNIIDRKRSRDFMMTFKAQFEQSGRLPMWELWGNETNCMIGFHSVSVIWNAYLRGVINLKELSELYPAVRAEAMNNRSGLDIFRQKGFLSVEDESESVSKTLEYSFNMYCVARIASVISYMNGIQNADQYRNDAEMFDTYAESWKNLRDVSTGFMTPRSNGGWLDNFDPRQVNNHYTEANSWQYTFAVQHNQKEIRDNFLLSCLFNTNSETSGRKQADITGLIGQYAHGNEPSHHFAYLFSSVDSVSKYVKLIRDSMYKPVPDGLCGNDDCGQMSAWYVFSAMGFYPLNPAGTEMVFGDMLFDSVRISNGNSYTVVHRRKPDEHLLRKGKYRSASRISHLLSGENYYYAFAEKIPEPIQLCPPEAKPVKVYLSSPVIMNAKEVFKDSMDVYLKSNNRFDSEIQAQEQIYYTLNGKDPDLESVQYNAGEKIRIRNSCVLKVLSVAVNDSGEVIGKSAIAVAKIFIIRNDYSIELKSDYNAQYTAGGPGGLIDGLHGDLDWRKGRWQGYQGVDFEAIVDLKKISAIDTVIIGFLEDRRSWIFLPQYVEVFGSVDGINYESMGVLDYLNISLREMSTGISPALFYFPASKHNYRYIKVRAVNFGKLPDWHPGAGGDAFIFVDEIEIR